MVILRFVLALIVCIIAVALPYRWRVRYFQFISFLVHLPFKAFGRVAALILASTDTENPFSQTPKEEHE